MSESASAFELAERFETAAAALIDYAAALTPAQWLTFCPGEERPVAALVHHLAWGFDVEIDAFRAMAEQRPVSRWTVERLNEVNADDGTHFAACDQAETLTLLRDSSARAAAVLRAFTPEQLERSDRYTESGRDRTVRNWIELVLIGHIELHLRSIRAALQPPV